MGRFTKHLKKQALLKISLINRIGNLPNVIGLK